MYEGGTCERCGHISEHRGMDCIYSTPCGALCPDCMYEALGKLTSEGNNMKELTVVINGLSDECLYIDGKAWKNVVETTVYAVELAEAAGGEPCMLKHVGIDGVHDEWPDTLEEALKEPESD